MKNKKLIAFTIFGAGMLMLTTNIILPLAEAQGKKLGTKYNLSESIYRLTEHADFSLSVPKAKAEEKELSIKEYVKIEVEKAGLNWEEAEKIIQCESGWNPDAHNVNWENRAGVDRGLWQISSLHHKEVSNSESYDYKKSTEHAIRIYKDRGNWSAWACSRRAGIK